MANKNLFKSLAGPMLPKADTRNEAGGTAYALSPNAQLARYAATGCLNSTFYADASEQLALVLGLANIVAPEFVARTALYTRRVAHMKDIPALLVAVLSRRSPRLMAEVFDRVIDNGKMLRTFVQIMRSGAVGRKSLGSLPKRLVQQWFEQRSDTQVFFASIGNDPSLADVIRMVHPKPFGPSRQALYGYLIGKEVDTALLPPEVLSYEAFKMVETLDLPDVPHEMLTSLPLSPNDWKTIAMNASWQTTRMNLNTFARHGVFDDPRLVSVIAAKLRKPELIARARVMPYQLLAAYLNLGDAATTASGISSFNIPMEIKSALQDAIDLSLANVPTIAGKVWVCLDVSGSMHSPITGYRKGSTSAVRCVDAAALFAAAVLRANPSARIIPFTETVHSLELNPRDSVMTNAAKMAAMPPGGTNLSAPIELLNQQHETGDLVIFVSDNQSWVDSAAPRIANQGVVLPSPTRTLEEWSIFKQRSQNARLVCLDVQPCPTTQAQEREDILNIGGFSDRVFDVIASFANGTLAGDHWVGVIEHERV